MRYVLHPDVEKRAGRVGDIVTFMRGGRALSRRFVQPGNPKSSPQLQSRSNLVKAAAVWSTCTPTERAGWDALAALYFADKLDSLGNPAPWTGHMLCTATHLHRYHYGAAPDTDAYLDPLPLIPSELDSVHINQSDNWIYTELTSIESNRIVRIRFTPVLSAVDYAPNPVFLRFPVLPEYSTWGYASVQGSIYANFPLGGGCVGATPALLAIETGDNCGVELLSLSESFVPCPSGPILAVFDVRVTT